MTATPTWSNSPTFTFSPTITPTPSITPTFTNSPTFTQTRTPIVQDGLLELCGIFPSPFKEEEKLCYVLLENSRVSVTVFNVAGEVILQQEENVQAGSHIFIWQGTNQAGARLASGIYFLRVFAVAHTGQKGLRWINVALSR